MIAAARNCHHMPDTVSEWEPRQGCGAGGFPGFGRPLAGVFFAALSIAGTPRSDGGSSCECG